MRTQSTDTTQPPHQIAGRIRETKTEHGNEKARDESWKLPSWEYRVDKGSRQEWKSRDQSKGELLFFFFF